MDIIWKTFDEFPDYNSLKELSSHYYNGILKIVVATEKKSFRLIELHALGTGMSLMTIGLFSFGETKKTGRRIDGVESILLGIDEYESSISDGEWFSVPDRKYKWCFLSELHSFLESSVV